MRKLLLRSFQSPGDVVMLTAAVRDLHLSHPGGFQTDVRTSADALWQHNPYITPLKEGSAGTETLDMHYPLVHGSNRRPYHFIHGYAQFLEQRLSLSIPLSDFRGDVRLSEEEKSAPCPGVELGVPERFWIIVAGGKYDFTAKWWNPTSAQQVVDHFQGRVAFVQTGEQGHWHTPLKGVVNLIGKTKLRDFIRLMYHAEGVLCPVTFAMHLAAAVETKPGRGKNRPCVVVAGGREPSHWEAYTHHQYISTNGMLSCCLDGGCWKSRCQLVGDGDAKDRNDVCTSPVQVSPDLRIPQCMDMISSQDVIRRIEMYYQGGGMNLSANCERRNEVHSTGFLACDKSREVGATSPKSTDTAIQTAPPATVRPQPIRPTSPAKLAQTLLIEFRHGLGDAVQFTSVLKHLKQVHPDWQVDVAALRGKHSAYHGLCRKVLVLNEESINKSAYSQVYQLDWHECGTAHGDWPSTKPSRCLLEVFGITPMPELCRYEIQQRETRREAARAALASYCPAGPLSSGRFPSVLIHYQGNTSGDRKDLPHDLIRDVCEVVIKAGYVPIILDWDRRSSLIDNVKIFNPDADHELWGGRRTGDAETLTALIEASSLMIGVDSGPLHAAGATSTPAIGVWTQHHPVHFFDLAENVTHMVPGDHEKNAAGRPALDYFSKHYKHHVYKQLYIELPALTQSLLTGDDFEQLANKRFLCQLTSKGFTERYYYEHRLAGLDYLNFGDWQRQYGRWLVQSLNWKGRRVLEVGCACGSILRGLGEAGAVVQGVEINEYMVRLGRDKWPDMAPLLHICDAVNLHLFADGEWEGIHSSQVAEHWKPKLVPHILEELHRVTAPGGIFFCALDTEELFARQGRTMETEDPTHVCIKPLAWWHEQLSATGWQVCTDEFQPLLNDHQESFLKRYDWDWFCARRQP
ncbi:MAG: ADP-heptose:LPS heptosyltransferase-like protein [Planctomycetaceae bacterium]|nr:ADP-heptose:LPS heptosyltransferase-like protein [Planctomycetaceae bacterium]